MTSASLRVDLLHQLCALLPEQDASLIRMMPTDDLMTYVEAYSAARRAGADLPLELRREFVSGLIEQIEVEFAEDSSTAEA